MGRLPIESERKFHAPLHSIRKKPAPAQFERPALQWAPLPRHLAARHLQHSLPHNRSQFQSDTLH